MRMIRLQADKDHENTNHSMRMLENVPLFMKNGPKMAFFLVKN